MTNVYQAEMLQIVEQTLQRRTAWIEAQLVALQAGETLCVHDDRGDYDLHRDRITVRESAHVLEPDETCDERVRREQYGPAPADWRAVVNEHNSREAS